MSNLDAFISTMMTNDAALQEFLADPISSEEKYGLRKSDRSVVRRVVNHLPPTAKSGFAMKRSLSSYRRSFRLLQNVLHHTGTQYVIDSDANLNDSDSTSIGIILYYTGDKNNPGAPLMYPGLAYSNYCYGFGTGNTLAQVMGLQIPSSKPAELNGSYPAYQPQLNGQRAYGNVGYTATLINDEYYITAFTIPETFKGPGTYTLIPTTSTVDPSTRKPFWFYSVNGQAIEQSQITGIYKLTGASYGDEGKSFANYPVDSNTQSLVWQAIAPDQDYGFGSCYVGPQKLAPAFGGTGGGPYMAVPHTEGYRITRIDGESNESGLIKVTVEWNSPQGTLSSSFGGGDKSVKGTPFHYSIPDGVYINSVKVTRGPYYQTGKIVYSLQFTTSDGKTSEVFGQTSNASPESQTFTAPSQTPQIIGFFGCSGSLVDSLGVYVDGAPTH